MKLFFPFSLILAVFLSSCSTGMVLKKKVGPAPDNVLTCPKEVQDPFYMCKPDPHAAEVTDPS